jgi:hypothetical protein
MATTSPADIASGPSIIAPSARNPSSASLVVVAVTW